MPTQEKEETIQELRTILQESRGAILTDYRGLSVADLTDLRKKLRSIDGEFHIVKNTLFKRAADGVVADEALVGYLEGPTAIGFAKGDTIAVTKALLDFAKDHKALSVKAGLVDGKIYDQTGIVAISKLPSKEVLISQLLGSLNAPISNLVGTLAGITSNFVYTLQAIADKQAASA
jgi:large subunit ribosomal protein L10